jgi:methyltransferase
MSPDALARHMEQMVSAYIQGCNHADAAAIAACFAPGGVHYVAVNDQGAENVVGGEKLGAGFAARVRATGVRWTVDYVITDPDRHLAILEWSSFSRTPAKVRRGIDWFVFDPPTAKIADIRTYFATMPGPSESRTEHLDFDYAGRGYPTPREPRP